MHNKEVADLWKLIQGRSLDKLVNEQIERWQSNRKENIKTDKAGYHHFKAFRMRRLEHSQTTVGRIGN